MWRLSSEAVEISAAGGVWIRIGMVSLLLAAVLLIAAPPELVQAATSCTQKPNMVLELSVVREPVAVGTDFRLSDLQQMAGQVSQTPPHPILGFYTGAVGYNFTITVQTATPAGSKACDNVKIDARLVSTQRRIEIARDLKNRECLFRAALKHYRSHATAADVALDDYAAKLKPTLQDDVERFLTAHPLQPGDNPELKRFVNDTLDKAVAEFSKSLGPILDRVDTASEAQRLQACDYL